MTILCVSDHRDPLVYSSLIKERFGKVDVVLGAGDLLLEYYGFIVSSLNRPLFFVFGNHNLAKIGDYRQKYSSTLHDTNAVGPYIKPSYGSTYIGGKFGSVGGLLIAGLGGCRRYNSGINQFTEFQMFRRMLRLVPKLLFNRLRYGRYVDILLTHAPPWDIGDLPDTCHRGFKVFLLFMRWFRPAYLIHGHVHLYDLNAKRVSKFACTTVINVFNHYVFEYEVPHGT